MIHTSNIIKYCFYQWLTQKSILTITNDIEKERPGLFHLIYTILLTSNSNHGLKSAVDMPICVLKRGDLCERMSSHENEARFLHQNDVNLHDGETKWLPTKICSACICTGPQCKHKIRLAVSHCRP